MHVEICNTSRIDLWQLLGSGDDGPQRQAALVDRFPSKNLRNHQRATSIRAPGSKGIGSTSLPDNPLTIANLRKGQSLSDSKLPFLSKLHELLDDVEKTGDDHIVSWLPHGRGFRVHRPKSFVQQIIPHYFKQSKYKSFQRQLHLYEFVRTPRGPEAGAYSHPKFLRGNKYPCLSLSPKKIKGKFHKKANLPNKVPLNVEDKSAMMETVVYPPTRIENNMMYWTATNDVVVENNEQPSKSLLSSSSDWKTKISSDWKTKIENFLVTGASLAAELEGKKDKMVPHSGDVVYVFDGCPFRYLEEGALKMEESSAMPVQTSNIVHTLDHEVEEQVDDFMGIALGRGIMSFVAV